MFTAARRTVPVVGPVLWGPIFRPWFLASLSLTGIWLMMSDIIMSLICLLGLGVTQTESDSELGAGAPLSRR